jgi:GcrA cell cycle regulator
LTSISEYPKLIGGCQNENKDKKVEQTNWAPEHSELLRELVARGLSYAEIANAINAKFRTCYSRNAAIGRAKRMGIAESDRAKPQPLPRQPPLDKILERRPSESRASEFRWPMPNFERAEPVALRCVGVDPRHLSLLDLEREDCRYPYGGDEEGEAITFCGHPRRKGSSYCTPHFHLTCDPGALPEPAVSTAPLRLVDAAQDF